MENTGKNFIMLPIVDEVGANSYDVSTGRLQTIQRSIADSVKDNVSVFSGPNAVLSASDAAMTAISEADKEGMLTAPVPRGQPPAVTGAEIVRLEYALQFGEGNTSNTK